MDGPGEAEVRPAGDGGGEATDDERDALEPVGAGRRGQG